MWPIVAKGLFLPWYEVYVLMFNFASIFCSCGKKLRNENDVQVSCIRCMNPEDLAWVMVQEHLIKKKYH